MNFKDVPIPAGMRMLPHDQRSYPIPYLVVVDDTGKPHFTISDERKRARIILEDRCSICGRKLLRGRWLVGGPLAAFHPHGAYLDPPMHDECAHYALKVCPYLAAPRYSGEVGDKTMSSQERAKHVVIKDKSANPERPDVFVAVFAIGTVLIRDDFGVIKYIKPKEVRRYEWWRHGEQVPEPPNWKGEAT